MRLGRAQLLEPSLIAPTKLESGLLGARAGSQASCYGLCASASRHTITTCAYHVSAPLLPARVPLCLMNLKVPWSLQTDSSHGGEAALDQLLCTWLKPGHRAAQEGRGERWDFTQREGKHSSTGSFASGTSWCSGAADVRHMLPRTGVCVLGGYTTRHCSGVPLCTGLAGGWPYVT